ncbi:MAG: succinate dehydrogenase [Desulfobacteraceae bacterium 4572_19]|nr:MAG: succinate dehydrogenase [Desulfobacteraceae bacterium 4572_19]
MNRLTQILSLSVGKKMIMAVTGLCFCGFLVIHLLGNLTIYGGQELFNSYAKHLHTLGPVLIVAEWILLALFTVHIIFGTILFFKNLAARPVKYQVKKNGGGRSIGSMTMPYTGFIIFAFVIFHLFNFHFVDKTNQTIFQIVDIAFNNPIYVVLYITAIFFVAVHVSHGFWSAFQTLGIDHPNYTPCIKLTSIILSLIIATGFGFLPIFLNIYKHLVFT